MSWGYGYREYVPVAKRKSSARKDAQRRAKKQKRDVQPVAIQGSKIAKTFWGKAWCDHLESFSDYSNRLPRGRTYVRNGSVVDLQISAGRLDAIVAGSETYEIQVDIDQLKAAQWKKIRNDCSASIDSLMDLLSGRFSDGVMRRLTQRTGGLLPSPKEIHLGCSCPDWATMCKHVAAVLYGVGAHLDSRPELLFLLRGVDHTELVSEAVSDRNLNTAFGKPSGDLAGEDLEAMFGIELDGTAGTPSKKASTKKKRATTKKKAGPRAAKKKTGAKKAAVKKKAAKKTVNRKAATKKTAKKKSAGREAPMKKAAAKKKAATKTAATKKKAARRRSTKSQ